MDLSQYIRTLREDLAAAAAVGDESSRQAAAILTAALEPAARLAIMNALSDFAAEVTAQLDGASVEVRLDGRDVRVAVDQHTETPFESESFTHIKSEPVAGVPGTDQFGRAIADASGELSRTTVRIFNDLKSQAEEAASARGESLNAFISRAISESVRTRKDDHWGHGRRKGPRKPGQNITGFIQG
ncbi:toxin-antitoxin system HicB family antitoxin [Nakamurella silvestris]|nr:toxin-antitoxin system HicB family antitoxin [Nakamurella silvestris]